MMAGRPAVRSRCRSVRDPDVLTHAAVFSDLDRGDTFPARSVDHATPHWPNLFVVGVMRGGTTSLCGYLERHPEIFMSPVKEPHFFTRAGATLAPRYATKKAYLDLFKG